jgi:hypothetical protein
MARFEEGAPPLLMAYFGVQHPKSLPPEALKLQRRRVDMPKFLTIGYGDREGYDRTDAAVRDAAHAHDAWLRKAGALMGIAGTPVQVRNTDAKNIETQTGPFMSCSLPVAGFAVIEAATLADAVNLVSQTPCAVAHGVVEVWPLNQTG